jgi:hypothetical protein
MLSYVSGIDLSFEHKLKRTALIPCFGVQFGGLSQKQAGSSVQFIPTIGLHVIARRNLIMNARSGFVYPLSNFEMLSGWKHELVLNFTLW